MSSVANAPSKCDASQDEDLIGHRCPPQASSTDACEGSGNQNKPDRRASRGLSLLERSSSGVSDASGEGEFDGDAGGTFSFRPGMSVLNEMAAALEDLNESGDHAGRGNSAPAAKGDLVGGSEEPGRKVRFGKNDQVDDFDRRQSRGLSLLERRPRKNGASEDSFDGDAAGTFSFRADGGEADDPGRRQSRGLSLLERRPQNRGVSEESFDGETAGTFSFQADGSEDDGRRKSRGLSLLERGSKKGGPGFDGNQGGMFNLHDELQAIADDCSEDDEAQDSFNS